LIVFFYFSQAFTIAITSDSVPKMVYYYVYSAPEYGSWTLKVTEVNLCGFFYHWSEWLVLFTLHTFDWISLCWSYCTNVCLWWRGNIDVYYHYRKNL